MTAIEWTDETWNPIVGCSVVSPGCTNCYAMRMAARLEKIGVPHYAGTTKPSKAGAVWTGKLALAPNSILLKPLKWKNPRRIFVNSMGDLFHESIPDEWIDKVFAVMALCPQHQFQVLTKRAERMLKYVIDCGRQLGRQGEIRHWIKTFTPWAADQFGDHRETNATVIRVSGSREAGTWNPLPSVWLGISAERQEEADERIPLLLQTPAAVRFVSLEPLLGPIDLARINGDPRWQPSLYNSLTGERRVVERGGSVPVASKMDFSHLDWVICGGESGPGARPMHPDWARSLRDQCKAADVPFFFKQWGSWRWGGRTHGGWYYYPGGIVGGRQDGEGSIFTPNNPDHDWGDGYVAMRCKKQAAGRLLDGVEHSEWPVTA